MPLADLTIGKSGIAAAFHNKDTKKNLPSGTFFFVSERKALFSDIGTKVRSKLEPSLTLFLNRKIAANVKPLKSLILIFSLNASKQALKEPLKAYRLVAQSHGN